LAIRRYNAHPQSAPGDFYVVHNECITCGAPHVVAPDLIGWVDGDTSHCIWKKQPETAEDLEQAIAVFAVAEVGCHRYAGDDPDIIKRIGWDYCDAPLPSTHPPRIWDNDTIATPAFRLLQANRPLVERIRAAIRSLLGMP
jgi:hypothetical protein